MRLRPLRKVQPLNIAKKYIGLFSLIVLFGLFSSIGFQFYNQKDLSEEMSEASTGDLVYIVCPASAQPTATPVVATNTPSPTATSGTNPTATPVQPTNTVAPTATSTLSCRTDVDCDPKLSCTWTGPFCVSGLCECGSDTTLNNGGINNKAVAQTTDCNYYGSTGLQQAVNDAGTDWAIIIKEGTYSNLSLQVSKNTTIINHSANVHPAILKGTSASPVISVTGGKLELIGIEVTEGKYGIQLTNSAILRAYNIIIDNQQLNGIYAQGSSIFEIYNSVINNNGISTTDTTSNKSGFNLRDQSIGKIINTIVSGHQGNFEAYAITANENAIVEADYSLLFNNKNGNVKQNGNGKVSLGAGIITVDPLFVDTNYYKVRSNSPTIDAGDPAINDFGGSRSDIGLYGGSLLCIVDKSDPRCTSNVSQCTVKSDCPADSMSNDYRCNTNGVREVYKYGSSFTCEKSICTPNLVVLDWASDPCPTNKLCSAGQCVDPACTQDSDCPINVTTETKTCLDLDTIKIVKTTLSHTCNANKFCAPIVVDDTTSQDCATNTTCDSGECVGPNKPTFDPVSNTKFSDKLDVTISVTDDSVTKLTYKINNGSFVEYTSATKPLSVKFTIDSTSSIEAYAYRNDAQSRPAMADYQKVTLGKPAGLISSCSDTGSQITFVWNAVSDAKAYLVRLNKDGAFTPNDLTSGDQQLFTTNTTYTVTNLIANQMYNSWSVQPLFSIDQTPENYDRTKDLITDAGSIICNPVNSSIPTIDPYETVTFLETYKLSGTKPAGSSIMADGIELSPANTSTTWMGTVSLTQLGLNKFNIYSKLNGVDSLKVPVVIERCEIGDLNCDGYVNITDFSLFAKAIQFQIKIDNGIPSERLLFMKLADLNMDGKNNVGDFAKFKDAYVKHN